MRNIYLLCGGPSSEHDIALRSGKNILENLDEKKYKIMVVYVNKEGKFATPYPYQPVASEFDLVREVGKSRTESIGDFCLALSKEDPANTVIIPCIHGTYGEDGTIQGLLDCLGFSYIGNGLLSSAICMDKETSNDIFEKHGLKQARYLSCRKTGLNEAFLEKCESYIGYPMIVKPSANGSSVGVSKVTSREELEEGILEALKFDKKALVEELIEGQEIEIAVIGDERPQASKPGAYTTSHTFLDYDAKYFDTKTVSALPYPMPEEDEKKAGDFAVRAYQACGCEGFARVDIFYGKDKDFYINEINTFPGFTKTSFFAALRELTYGKNLGELLDDLIEKSLRDRENHD